MSVGTLPETVVTERLDWAAATLEDLGYRVVAPPGTKENAWSLIASFNTSQGHVFLKYVRGAFLQEPRLTRALHRLAPEVVPDIVAENPALGCWLVASGGTSFGLPDFIASGHVQPLLRAHAALQRATLAAEDAWLQRGAKDLRPGKWPAYLTQIRTAREALEIDGLPQETINGLARAAPALARLCDRLAALRPPITVVHMDLRRTNIKLRRGRARIIDWGDAGIGPAFLDPVPLFSEIAALGLAEDTLRDLTDCAVEPWADMAPKDDLRAAQRICRTVFPLLYAHGLIHARPSWDPTLRPTYHGLLRFYLRTFLDRLDDAGG